MGYRFEVWTHPGSGTFKRQVLRLPVISAKISITNSGRGSGRILLPPRWPTGTIIRRDPLNPANDVRSVIRIFEDGEDENPLVEVVPIRVPDAINPSKPIELTCVSLEEGFFGDATVWAWDHPAWKFPDWVWGGVNVITNPDMEDGMVTPARYEMWDDATGGSWDMIIDGTTVTIPFNATAVSFKLLLVAAGFVQSEVRGSGTEADPFEVSLSDPYAPVVTFNEGALTGGGLVASIVNNGRLEPSNWEQSNNPVTGQLHGQVSQFRLTEPPEPAFNGNHSLLVDGVDIGAFDYPGAQQTPLVIPGGIYQGKFRIRTSATDTMRFVLRTMVEGDPPIGADEHTPTPNTWDASTLFEIPNVIMPDNVEQIIFRGAYVGGGDPGIFYLDAAELREGLAPATAGEIARVLLDDCVINHAADAQPRTILDWIDYTALISDTLDAAGVPWAELLSWRVTRGTYMYQVFEGLRQEFGIEFALKWHQASGKWQLSMWNPDGRGADNGVAVIVGIDKITAGPVSFDSTAGNAMLAEGAERIWARAEDTNSIAAVGRIERYTPLGNILDQASLDAAAAEQLIENLEQGLSVTLVSAPGAEPKFGTTVLLGDTVTITVPNLISRNGYRLDKVDLDWRRGDSECIRTGVFSREALSGQAAVNQMVAVLAARAAVLPPPEAKLSGTGLPRGGTGGQAPTVIVAANDSSDLDKKHADIVCRGGVDNSDIWQALTLARSGFPAALPGWVHFSAGHYDVDMSLGPAFDAQDLMITGVGFGYSGNGTVFDMFGTPDSVRPFLFEGEYSIFKDFGIADNTDYSHSITGIYASELTTVDNVRGWTSGHFIEVVSGSVAVKNCEAMFSGYGGDTGPNHCVAISGAVQYIHITDNILTGTDGYGVHTYGGNFFVETSTINGNIISDTGIGGIFLGITGADGTGTTGSRWGWAVVGNSLESTGTDWVDLTDRGAAIYLEYCPGSSVVGNTIANAFGHGIIVDASAGGSNIDPWLGSGGGLILSGNAITRSTGYPIWFRNEDTEIKYYPVTVAANHIGADSFDDAMICVFERVRDVAIVGNGFQRGGLYLLECEQMSIIGNKFADASYGNDGGTTGKTGIIELDDCHWCTVKDNDFQAAEGVVSNNPFACIYLVNGSDQNRIRGNDYLGAAALSVGATLIDHGVWFAASAGVNNRAVGNDFERCTGASIRDDVGGNITAWPGGGNDNW